MNQHFRSQINETLFTLKISACGFNIDTLNCWEQFLNSFWTRQNFFFTVILSFEPNLEELIVVWSKVHTYLFIYWHGTNTLCQNWKFYCFSLKLLHCCQKVWILERKKIFICPVSHNIYTRIDSLFQKILIFQDNNWWLLF